jgi:hypothetical protein
MKATCQLTVSAACQTGFAAVCGGNVISYACSRSVIGTHTLPGVVDDRALKDACQRHCVGAGGKWLVASGLEKDA